ncbi:LacI family DNA-binding transcriptional regulator [Pseudoxanthomonas sp.]|uniref:LacI family DNA-binding transcriptional regulator n=1 Tax=Pseudoxanthomonas sp. TaxID=1871049 RepID=UPI0026082077|nr:LacI family DNA-binding transcriptional regulator [Pseudoxanthomonas sp.]WDS34731.1 MAG: LacI family DNA-binding transcriptional regulator [Pseudoxanthomonas sp.]
MLKAAGEIHYRPNALPAMLQTGRSGLIAVVMGGFYNPVYAEILRCITAALKARNLESLLVDAESDENLDHLVGELSRYRIDGAISTLAIRSPKVASNLERLGIPIVAINSRRHGKMRVVSTSNRTTGSTAGNALIERGCRKLAYLAGRDNPSQHDRQRSFCKAVTTRGLAPPEIVVAGFTYEEGYLAASRLFASGARPDGIFCVNDLVAIGAMDAIKLQFGLRVPEDVQVIGCDDIPMAGWRRHDLTTFAQDMEALGVACADLLQDEPPAQTLTIPSQLILRGTTLP